MDRLARFWAHKHWKVRHGLLQFVAEMVCMLGEQAVAAREPHDPKAVLNQVLRLVEDPERWVEAVGQCCLFACLARLLFCMPEQCGQEVPTYCIYADFSTHAASTKQ